MLLNLKRKLLKEIRVQFDPVCMKLKWVVWEKKKKAGCNRVYVT